VHVRAKSVYASSERESSHNIAPPPAVAQKWRRKISVRYLLQLFQSPAADNKQRIRTSEISRGLSVYFTQYVCICTFIIFIYSWLRNRLYIYILDLFFFICINYFDWPVPFSNEYYMLAINNYAITNKTRFVLSIYNCKLI